MYFLCKVCKTNCSIYSTHGQKISSFIRVFNSPRRLITRVICSPIRITRTTRYRNYVPPVPKLSNRCTSNTTLTSLIVKPVASIRNYSYTFPLCNYNSRHLVHYPEKQTYTSSYIPIQTPYKPNYYVNPKYKTGQLTKLLDLEPFHVICLQIAMNNNNFYLLFTDI